MTDDPTFYELATQFPEAILALLGVETSRPYKAEAVDLKVARRLDVLLSPAELGPEVVALTPTEGATRYYVEYQARSDPDVERNLLLKVVAHCTKDRWTGRTRAIVLYTDEAFRKIALPAEIRGRRGRRRKLVAFDVEQLVLSRDLDPRTIAGRGWAARLVMPLVGKDDEIAGRGWAARLVMPLVGKDDEVVIRGAGRWLAELEAALKAAPERLVAARELFTHLLAERLPGVEVYALLEGKEEAVENTATGRALIAKGAERERRKAILEVLEARGLEVPSAIRERLDRETDLERLAAILRAALSVGKDLRGLFPD